jgi:hypothetical protein
MNCVNKSDNSAKLNSVFIIDQITDYTSIFPFCSKSYVLLLAYVNATFKAERKLQTFLCSLRGIM